LTTQHLASANRLPDKNLKVGQRLFIPLPPETGNFLWPVRGTLRSPGSSHGIDIAAPAGSLVRASRSGRVAVATRKLSGWGQTVVIDHLDGYLSVYAGLGKIHVAPGATLRQGATVGSLGGRDLHFEIRLGNSPKNALALLPKE
jgi:murein DD-endopeptidase MepM/ murein hydrolase activator NlpD